MPQLAEIIENEAVVSGRETYVGQLIREARLQAGRTLDQMSDETRISTEYIDAIESGKLNALIAPVYAIGFTRTLARSLGLDAEAAAKAMRQKIDAERPSWRRYSLD